MPANESTGPDKGSDLSQLKNLGPESSRWLRQVGIHTLSDLQIVGALGAYTLVRKSGQPASLNLVYAIEAALRGIHWLDLPPDIRDELKVAVRLMPVE